MFLCAALLLAVSLSGQTAAVRPAFDTFDAATVKPANGDEPGRFIKLEGTNRFLATNYTLRLLIAAAFELNPRTISGGPAWVDSEHFDIVARTPGDQRPTREEQMHMLRGLLADRFHLSFHREKREFAIFALELAKDGPKLKLAASPDQPPTVGPGVVYDQRIVLPGRNATVAELASLLQRAIVERPVVDRTGLTARYDFDLTWAPDATQFGGDVKPASESAPSPPLAAALRQQLGLQMEPKRGYVEALIIDSAVRLIPQ